MILNLTNVRSQTGWLKPDGLFKGIRAGLWLVGIVATVRFDPGHMARLPIRLERQRSMGGHVPVLRQHFNGRIARNEVLEIVEVGPDCI